MRILYVIEKLSGTGGLQRILTDKMNYLAEHTAHEVVLMTVWHSKEEPTFKLSDKIRRIKLNVPLLNIKGGYIASMPLALHRFNKYIKRANPDICIFFRAMGAFLITATNWKGKKIFEAHTDYKHSNHNWLYPLMQKKADVIVCLTNGDSKNYSAAKRVEVIPNFTTMQSDSKAPLTSKRCIAVGRLCKEKNFSRLVCLWNSIHRLQPEWTLDIYGDGEEKSALQELINDMKLNDCIELCGNTDNIKEEYLQSSILLMTSETEGMPMTLLEAMACGLPSVAFDCSHGPADIIRDGETGFLVPYNDDSIFIDKTILLMKDQGTRMVLADNAHNRAKLYQPAQIMSLWLKLFNNI